MNQSTRTPRSLPLPASLLAFAAALSFGLPASHAATLYWDTNGSTPGAGATANGTWDVGVTANWTTDSTGASTPTTFTAADTVIFSAGTDVATASITLSGAPTAQAITFEEGAYTLTGNLSINSSVTVATGATASFGGITTINNNAAFVIDGTLNTNINGGGKTLTKTGAGTLTLSDSNSSDYTVNANGGLVVLQRSTTKQLKASSVNSGGTLRLAANEQLGSSLTVNSGGVLEINANVSETVTTFSGAGTVTAGNNTSLGVTGGTFSGSLSGDLDLVKSGAGTFTFSGASTSTGNVTVSAGIYTLANTGSLTFYIGDNGINNTVTGAGTANFNGSFNFDLTEADLSNGNSWTIVNVATQTFAGTFAVNGFTDADNDNIWTNGAGFSFNEATGLLTYSAIPEPSTYAVLLAGGVLGASLLRRKPRHSTPKA